MCLRYRAYKWLNGVDFLDKEGVFTSKEKESIVSSKKDIPDGSYKDSTKEYIYEGLYGEKIFSLDFTELTNVEYGFPNEKLQNMYNAFNKDSLNAFNKDSLPWLLRSKCKIYISDTVNDRFAAVRVGAGTNSYISFYNPEIKDDIYISPAFNVDISKIFLSS